MDLTNNRAVLMARLAYITSQLSCEQLEDLAACLERETELRLPVQDLSASEEHHLRLVPAG